MKLWIDDVREAPSHDYYWFKTVKDAIDMIVLSELGYFSKVVLIDLDHDAGDYAKDGGDYIRILDWLESTGRKYPIRIHSMNPVGVENMRRIIQRNGWMEVR